MTNPIIYTRVNKSGVVKQVSYNVCNSECSLVDLLRSNRSTRILQYSRLKQLHYAFAAFGLPSSNNLCN
ncbi:hypothetical protein PUN28_015031 [Cardiocondyla obscurior]|uniref:Uncharacterized protein n=1 Tax=Cardiocondyla obscurior TaxID=286306 RepID=A0AAW2F1W4_9HYME